MTSLPSYLVHLREALLREADPSTHLAIHVAFRGTTDVLRMRALLQRLVGPKAVDAAVWRVLPKVRTASTIAKQRAPRRATFPKRMRLLVP